MISINCSIVKIFLFFGVLLFVMIQAKPPQIQSFEELGALHCESFPIQLLYRLSSGQVAEKYGSKYSALDCYIRQFINKDGQNKQQSEDQEQDEEDANENESGEQQQSQSQQSQQNSHQYPENDPIVIQYAKGLKRCLPSDVDNQVQAVYRIWRFHRYVVQHDYAFEWMRAKIRSGLGYEAERPMSWMDGEQGVKRLRLDKLFSNEFYDYVDRLMFRDFLYPFMTFLRKNVVVGLEGKLSKSGQPILFQYIESKNIQETIFIPIQFSINKTTPESIFTYTIPGIPLFLGGSTGKVAWAYTGVLVDRSNVEQIQTVGNKFYHHGIEQWVKLNNVSIPIEVKGEQQPFMCTYMHSSYGTLYEKHNRTGKVSEYIARWHEDEKKVRNVFTQTYNLILNNGIAQRNIEFPFNSLVIANKTGIFNYLCPQEHPSYFIYPDLTSQPDPLAQRWISQPKKGILTIVNTHLTTIDQTAYNRKEIMNYNEEQLQLVLKKLTSNNNKLNPAELWQAILSVSTDTLVKKRKQHMIYMYRKAKFVFFPQQKLRKQCDQLLSIVQKWDGKFATEIGTPVFALWDYFFREYTFNHVSSSEHGAAIAKHRALTQNYWTNQPQLWKRGVSYGECNSHLWTEQGWDVRLNGTGLNCTCFFNIARALNKTREILRKEDGRIQQNVALSQFAQKKIINLAKEYKGSHIDEAFGNFYSKNVAFVAEIGNPWISYKESYLQNEYMANIYESGQQYTPSGKNYQQTGEQQAGAEPKSPQQQQNTQTLRTPSPSENNVLDDQL